MTKAAQVVNIATFTTSAKVRAWGAASNAALTQCGLVQTTDTGQVDWLTVNHPGVAQTLIGYEIWRFNDTLQSSKPMFVKFYYYTNNSTGGYSPAVGIEIGSNTNGAGTLSGLGSGVVYYQYSYQTTNTSNVTAYNILACHTEGYFCYFTPIPSSSFPSTLGAMFMIDRTRDSDGNPTGEGFNFYRDNVGVGTMYHFNWNTMSARATFAGPMPPYDAVSVPGKVFPMYSMALPPKLVLGMVGVMESDAAQYTTFTCDPFNQGTQRVYIALKTSGAGAYNVYAAPSIANVTYEGNISVAFLWE